MVTKNRTVIVLNGFFKWFFCGCEAQKVYVYKDEEEKVDQPIKYDDLTIIEGIGPVIKKLLNIFKNFEIDYAESYKDGAPMVGIILKNSDKNVQDIYLSEIRERCRVMFKDKFGYGIYDYPQNVVNPRAPINRVRDFSKVKWLFDNMPNKYIDQLRHYSMYIKYLENDYTSSLYGKSLTLLDFFIDYVL